MQIILFVNIAICIERNCITKLSKWYFNRWKISMLTSGWRWSSIYVQWICSFCLLFFSVISSVKH
jgi:hypothetical protein